MKILALETSTKNFSLAVANGGKVIAERNIVLKKVLSSSIIPGIESILKKSRVPLEGLDAFAVGLGPGSFTSLRVGLSSVKALAFATQKPVIGISSLDILAMNVADAPQKNICVVCDARRNLVYSCSYLQADGKMGKGSKYALTDIGSVLKEIKKDTIFTGDAIPLYKDRILETVPGASFADERDWYPRAGRLIALAQERFLNHKFDQADTLVPLYLYPEDCQVAK